MLNVFAHETQSNSICLVPSRHGDPRDCALELVNLVEVAARLRSESLWNSSEVYREPKLQPRPYGWRCFHIAPLS